MVFELSPAIATALRSMPPGYAALARRIGTLTEVDDRVRAVWLAGSVGRGAADAGSDLDVVVTVTASAMEDFCARWRDWLATISATIIAHELPGMAGSFFSVTTSCERLDVVTESVATLGSPWASQRMALLDKDGLAAAHAARFPTPAPRPGPDPTALAAIVEEFLREQTIFPAAVVARQDWLLGVVGVMNAQLALYRLFVEANQPLPLMGVKQWSSRLTDAQRAILTDLPVPAPERESVIAAMRAVRWAVRTHGRAAVEAAGGRWPHDIDTAVAAYWEGQLGSAPDSKSPSTSSTARNASPVV